MKCFLFHSAVRRLDRVPRSEEGFALLAWYWKNNGMRCDEIDGGPPLDAI